MVRERIEGDLPDEFSPDRSTCEHCGRSISWDDVCYTHDAHGFAECGVIVGGGTLAVTHERVQVVLNPKVATTPGVDTRAEPVEWFRDV